MGLPINFGEYQNSLVTLIFLRRVVKELEWGESATGYKIESKPKYKGYHGKLFEGVIEAGGVLVPILRKVPIDSSRIALTGFETERGAIADWKGRDEKSFLLYSALQTPIDGYETDLAMLDLSRLGFIRFEDFINGTNFATNSGRRSMLTFLDIALECCFRFWSSRREIKDVFKEGFMVRGSSEVLEARMFDFSLCRIVESKRLSEFEEVVIGVFDPVKNEYRTKGLLTRFPAFSYDHKQSRLIVNDPVLKKMGAEDGVQKIFSEFDSPDTDSYLDLWTLFFELRSNYVDRVEGSEAITLAVTVDAIRKMLGEEGMKVLAGRLGISVNDTRGLFEKLLKVTMTKDRG